MNASSCNSACSVTDSMFVSKENDLVWDLPRVRGRYDFKFNLSKITWFKVGGQADVLYRPADVDDLSVFLKMKDPTLPVFMLGAGSNILVRDGGIKGCVIKLGSAFSTIEIQDTLVIVGAACLDRTLVLKCAEECLTGLEFLVGVPGTIGGAIVMNAGAYGSEVKDKLVWVEYLNASGQLVQVKENDLKMSYRHGNLPSDAIVVRACFNLEKGEYSDIARLVNENLQKREDSQPIKGRTGGSTFKNPSNSDKSAWQLIDMAGCRGLTKNDAMVSEKHCNFLLNTDQSTAEDIESLGEEVMQRVFDLCGIQLEWEIIRVGSRKAD